MLLVRYRLHQFPQQSLNQLSHETNHNYCGYINVLLSCLRSIQSQCQREISNYRQRGAERPEAFDGIVPCQNRQTDVRGGAD